MKHAHAHPPKTAAPDHDRPHTVLIVPHRGARVTRVVVSGWHVLLIQLLSRVRLDTFRVVASAVGVLALLAGMVGVTWQFLAVSGSLHDSATLREENLDLKARLTTVQEKIGHINDVLNRTKQLYETLQNISQISDPERKLGAPADKADPRDEVDPQQLSDSLDELRAEAQGQEEVLQALTGYFEDRKALLASAPAIWPARGWITSDFGFRLDPYTGGRKSHEGLDIANAIGTPIVAPADGIVIYAAWEGGYGNVLVIDHGLGIKTRYAHLSKFDVHLGDRVHRHQKVAALGSTGHSTGPHLHYEVRVNGVPENPRKFILEADPGDRRRSASRGD